MLVIGRKEGKDFNIVTPEGKVIRIIALKCGNNQVRLGIIADNDVIIKRNDKEKSIEEDRIKSLEAE